VTPPDDRSEHGDSAAGDAAELHRRLVALADPVRAEGERAYLKYCYEHVGVGMGPGRKLVKSGGCSATSAGTTLTRSRRSVVPGWGA
jgi:hypothetical protein